MDEVEINERFEKWRKPAVWVIVFFVFFVLYFFAYPVVLVRLINSGSFDDIPDWIDPEVIDNAISWSIVPIDWIYDNVDWYHDLLDRWID